MNALTTAVGLYVAFIFLTTWVSPTFKRRAVGYGLIADVSMHVTLQLMFGGDANGRAGMLIAGVFINLTMHAYRYMYGYETWSRGAGWVYHQPVRVARSVSSATQSHDIAAMDRRIAALAKLDTLEADKEIIRLRQLRADKLSPDGARSVSSATQSHDIAAMRRELAAARRRNRV